MIRFHWGPSKNHIEWQTRDRRLILTKKDGTIEEFPKDKRGALIQRLRLVAWYGISWNTSWFLGYTRWEPQKDY